MAVTTGHRWSLLAGLLYGGMALHFSDAMGFLDDPSMRTLVYSSVLSAAIIGGGSWSLLVEREPRRPIIGGVASGLLTGILSHFLMWPFYLVANLFLIPRMVVGSMVFGFWSILIFGLFTTPLAVLVGGGLGLVRRRRAADT